MTPFTQTALRPAEPSAPWSEVPEDLRRPIVSGIRWTVWLALAGVPFNYALRVLLARVGPQTLATYGLLVVYINFVAAFLFLGGNSVAIRFLPRLTPAQRPVFLRSFAAVIGLGLLPWGLACWLDPHWPALLFGPLGGPKFQLAMLLLAPIPILFSLMLAALKGVLEIAWAQALYRLVSFGSFAGYLLMIWLARPWFRAHAPLLVWGWYLILAGAGATFARRRLAKAGVGRARTAWLLPTGFWAYTLGLQGASALGFFTSQLDYLLILHLGGMARLGRYVALMTFVAAMIAALKLLLDSLMSSMTHALVHRDAQALPALLQKYLRLLLPPLFCFSALLACLARPLLAIYGPRYATLELGLRCLAPLAAIYGLNAIFGATLSALGHPSAEIVAKVVRITAYVALFFPLWHAWGITGAVLAWGGAEIPYQAISLYLLRRRAPFPLRMGVLYPAFLAGLAVMPGIVLLINPQTAPEGVWLGACLSAGFLFAARYTRTELKEMARLVWPHAKETYTS